eukprot:CAMPEP_0198226532 /NCGR_PEP_ID=MMETSP1445-20131203/105660_1 /TAXON_ID=36898 /ORGANISM="Pyramimonas sp., Strain CCMP2087" /LENGTH=443 /DNA_ID=CAMNT_0043906357 /DNA_START=238 /DNA_END=1566 /DNA_ORIENTATION=+
MDNVEEGQRLLSTRFSRHHRTKSEVHFDDGSKPVMESNNGISYRAGKIQDYSRRVLQHHGATRLASQIHIGGEVDPDWQTSRLPAPGLLYPRLKLPKSNDSTIQETLGTRPLTYKTTTNVSMQANAMMKAKPCKGRNPWDRGHSSVDNLLGEDREDARIQGNDAYETTNQEYYRSPPAKKHVKFHQSGDSNLPRQTSPGNSPVEVKGLHSVGMHTDGLWTKNTNRRESDAVIGGEVGSDPNECPAARRCASESFGLNSAVPRHVSEASGMMVRGSTNKCLSKVTLKNEDPADHPLASMYQTDNQRKQWNPQPCGAYVNKSGSTTTNSVVVLGTDNRKHYTSQTAGTHRGAERTDVPPGKHLNYRHEYAATGSKVSLAAAGGVGKDSGVWSMSASYPPAFVTPPYIARNPGDRPDLKSKGFFWAEGTDRRHFDTEYSAKHHTHK